MDEPNQQIGSDAVLKDFDCDTSLKGTADEEVENQSPGRNNSGVCNSDAIIEALNTNGADKESETQASDIITGNDLGTNQFQEIKALNENQFKESHSKFSGNSEDFNYNLRECNDRKTGNEINFGEGSTEKSNEKDSNSSDVSVCQEKEKENICMVEKTISIIEGQLTESDKKCDKSDLKKENVFNENITTNARTQDDNFNVKNKEVCINVVKEVISPPKEKCIENKSLDSSEESNLKKDLFSSLEESVNKTEIVCSKNVLEVIDEVLDVDDGLDAEKAALFENDRTFCESSGKNIEISDKIDTRNCEIITIINQQHKENSEKESDSRSVFESVLNEDINREEKNYPVEELNAKLKDKLDSSNSPLWFEIENKGAEMNEEISTSDGFSLEVNFANEGKDSQKEKSSEVDNSKNLVDEATESQKEKSSEADSSENLIDEDVEPQKEKSSEADSSEILIDEAAEPQKERSSETDSSENLIDEATDPQREKSEEVDSNENSQKYLKAVSDEFEKENSSFGSNNDSVQECNNSQFIMNSLNICDEQEEENINKNENDGNEIMDTEIVNCNEIEQIDLSENDTDLKGENRDEEMMADSLETATERCNEDQIMDGREDLRETDRSEMLIDEEVANQPGNSEEETITGDTTTQPSTELAKEKNEEVCIIPDDVIPVLSILPQNKEGVTVREEDNECLKVLKVSTPELLKPKTRAQDKRNQAVDSKPRPVRNAAKLAGNKIKSLVESDLVFDDSGDLEGENNFHENTDDSAQMCAQCREVKVCKLLSVHNDFTQYLCSEQCSAAYKATQMDAEPTEMDNTIREYARKCGQCHSQITIDENRLFWETMDFCNEDCLGKYQFELGSNCTNCKKSVPSTSLGKYCVRFGYDIKQFCSAVCLEEYKKGLKVCSYCQKDISTGVEGFLAPVGSKGQFKDFCSQSCMEKYDRMSSNKPLPEVIEECAVCSNSKPVQVEVELENKTHKLCSEPCFAAFKFVNNILEGQCDMCRKYFDRAKIPSYSLRLLFYDETLHSFCSKTCMNVYILANRKIVPCNWCKVKKYNFDMIKKVSPDGQLSMMCSLNCLMLYQTSVNAVCSRPIKCDYCKKKFVRQPLYHLTMSDATLRNFCSYNCVMSFQNGYPKQKDVVSGADQLSSPVPTGGPKRILPKRSQVESICVPVISSVQSLASPNGPISPSGRVQISRDVNLVSQVSQPLPVPASPVPAPPPQIYQQIITKPTPAKQMKNKSVLCKPYSHTKGVSCRPHPCMKETQTDQSLNRKFLIPIPVPIYVPAPMHMFATPFPVPVPFPLPIPVPIFIPTTRNSAKGIMKEIKKIQEKIPTDPFEAELLMMAEMVAGDKKQDPTDSESEDGNDGDENGDGTFSPENVDTSNTFGDDMLQMALKMASELEEPAVDMESVLTSNTITTSSQPAMDPNKALYASDTDDPDQVNVMAMNRNRKRSVRGSRNSSGGTPSKRGRRTSGSVDVPLLPPPEPVPPRTIEVEKPDANMCLKYTFGVNAWRHWVMQKNAELEKAALTNRKIKLFKPELLQLTADELNFSLCLFVKEVRKPNGTEYAPDTIYYLCLGIQQYLFENGRIDNIFTDSYYEKFTDCLDEVAKKFAALYNDSQYIVTRVEEEHLWESKQLGAHSPHVLLSTLMFFNTKHFNLVTVEEHMQLSFSHIMKHWKRNPNTPGVAKVPGSRNVLLRFYPPQSALEANSRKKKVYEQQENEENPLRCPVKLYEFYLSKCPESVKTRNDVFYLLPERSCVPDSPVWYSTMALGKEPLMKMLHRIKMVKEINIALLTS